MNSCSYFSDMKSNQFYQKAGLYKKPPPILYYTIDYAHKQHNTKNKEQAVL